MLDEVDAGRFDIRAHGARRNCLEAQGRRMFGNLFAFNETDLAAAWLSGFAAELSEVSRLAGYSLARDDLDFIYGLQRLGRLDWMQVQRCNSGGCNR